VEKPFRATKVQDQQGRAGEERGEGDVAGEPGNASALLASHECRECRDDLRPAGDPAEEEIGDNEPSPVGAVDRRRGRPRRIADTVVERFLRHPP
jgi:hypothetical protein